MTKLADILKTSKISLKGRMRRTCLKLLSCAIWRQLFCTQTRFPHDRSNTGNLSKDVAASIYYCVNDDNTTTYQVEKNFQLREIFQNTKNPPLFKLVIWVWLWHKFNLVFTPLLFYFGENKYSATRLSKMKKFETFQTISASKRKG